MTRKEIEKKIAETEAELKELKEELKKTENINPDVFVPKYNENYLTISFDGVIFPSYWNDTAIDKGRLAIGNVFRTKEEAEFEVERLKVVHKLRQYAEPRDTKWDGKAIHYHIASDTEIDNEIKVRVKSWYRHNDIYFSSEERAWEAIKAVGEDRIKKYYLCVEEGNI